MCCHCEIVFAGITVCPVPWNPFGSGMNIDNEGVWRQVEVDVARGAKCGEWRLVAFDVVEKDVATYGIKLI